MVYENSFPPIKNGITTLFDVHNNIKKIIYNMLQAENSEDKYLYFVGVDTLQFRLFYRNVCEECERINELFYNCGNINDAIVCPKMMFLFDNMNSCTYFRDYFEKIDDPEDKVRNELAYGSTDSIAMTLSIFHPIDICFLDGD